MYLLDTNVVSELRKAKKADRGVRMWAQALPAASLYLCAISILELGIGILPIEWRDRKQGSAGLNGSPCFLIAAPCPRSRHDGYAREADHLQPTGVAVGWQS